MLEGKQLPGAPQPALDLVEDERGLVTIGQLAAGGQEFLRRRLDAAFALYRLQDDGANFVVYRCAQSFDVVARREAHTLQHGIEILAILRLASKGERAHGAAVERI